MFFPDEPPDFEESDDVGDGDHHTEATLAAALPHLIRSKGISSTS